MNRWVALDPAYPPLAGDPLMAAPLLTTTTLLPGGGGFSSASRSQVNVILTSVCQLTENVSHVWCWSGRITGLAPATRMSTFGSYWSSRLQATVASAASATSVRMFALVVASSASAGPVRATATTAAPASANARAIPRPRPRLAPTTTVVLPDKSRIIVLFLVRVMVSVTGCLCLCLDGLCCYERRELALERLGRTAAPALGHGLRHGIGEDVLLPVLHSVEDGSRDGLRRGLRYVYAPGHIGVRGAGEDGMHPHPPSGQKSAQRLRQVERGRLGDRVGRNDRHGGEGVQRQIVDDGAPGTSQQRQEGLGHAIRAEQVHGELLLERGAIAEVVVKRDAGVVDEDVERLDSPGRGLNLRRAGHVQGQRRDAPVRVGQGLARTGIDPARASPQGFLDQRLPDAAIGPGHQNCLVGDCHTPSWSIRAVRVPRKPGR